MSTDRELLELAAKAAGIAILDWRSADAGRYVFIGAATRILDVRQILWSR